MKLKSKEKLRLLKKKAAESAQKEAERQQKIADEQRVLAEANEKRAREQEAEAIKQGQIARSEMRLSPNKKKKKRMIMRLPQEELKLMLKTSAISLKQKRWH